MFRYVLTLLVLALSFTHANPTPTRAFTAQAFQSPYPAGANGSVSGYKIFASNGLFYASPPSAIPSGQRDTVLYVDKIGSAFIVCPTCKPLQKYDGNSREQNRQPILHSNSISTPAPAHSPTPKETSQPALL